MCLHEIVFQSRTVLRIFQHCMSQFARLVHMHEELIYFWLTQQNAFQIILNLLALSSITQFYISIYLQYFWRYLVVCFSAFIQLPIVLQEKLSKHDDLSLVVTACLSETRSVASGSIPLRFICDIGAPPCFMRWYYSTEQDSITILWGTDFPKASLRKYWNKVANIDFILC